MMLRAILAGASLVLFGIAFLLALTKPGLWAPAAVLALIAGAILFENSRYRRRATPSGTLVPTSERFVDPETGRPTRVWIGANGDRHYIPEEG